MKVVPVPVREDNYAYLLVDESSGKAAAVDPFDVAKVSAAADAHNVQIVAGITTHHHFDHSGGNEDFSLKYPHAVIYGASDKIPALTKLVADKDHFTVGDNIHVKCLATPCHTRDSICYYATDALHENQPGVVFTGDTLFTAGCGRFFEGVGSEMIAALDYLASLPNDTVVYNGHEYTIGSMAFGTHIDPANAGLSKLANLCKDHKVTTGLSTIGDEKEWNVFMRLDSSAVREATCAASHTPKSEIMDLLREQKNKFRG